MLTKSHSCHQYIYIYILYYELDWIHYISFGSNVSNKNIHHSYLFCIFFFFKNSMKNERVSVFNGLRLLQNQLCLELEFFFPKINFCPPHCFFHFVLYEWIWYFKKSPKGYYIDKYIMVVLVLLENYWWWWW